MSQAAEALRREIEALYHSGSDAQRLRELQARYSQSSECSKLDTPILTGKS